jgi:hypothetical protein
MNARVRENRYRRGWQPAALIKPSVDLAARHIADVVATVHPAAVFNVAIEVRLPGS